MSIFDKEVDTLVRLIPERQPFVVRSAITLGLVLLSFLIRLAVGEWGDSYGFMFFIPAIVLVAVLLGLDSGLIAVVASASAVALLLDWDGSHHHFTALGIFFVIGGGLALLGDALRRVIDSLNQARAENEILLEEMSHRVKNKFAVIISVIRLQAKTAPADAHPALDAIARRVHALAALHTHLQESRRSGLVNMQDYLRDLCAGLRDTAGHLRKVTLAVVAEPFLLPPREATAIGLIVNELTMNCYKYAFPNERTGMIRVTLMNTEGRMVLRVADNGVESPVPPVGGTGTELVTLLSEQLGASVERVFLPEGGCVATVTAPMTAQSDEAYPLNYRSNKPVPTRTTLDKAATTVTPRTKHR